MSVPGRDQFESTYAEWVDHSPDDARRSAAEPRGGPVDHAEVLTPEQLADASDAGVTGEPPVREDDTRIEP